MWEYRIHRRVIDTDALGLFPFFFAAGVCMCNCEPAFGGVFHSFDMRAARLFFVSTMCSLNVAGSLAFLWLIRQAIRRSVLLVWSRREDYESCILSSVRELEDSTDCCSKPCCLGITLCAQATSTWCTNPVCRI